MDITAGERRHVEMTETLSGLPEVQWSGPEEGIAQVVRLLPRQRLAPDVAWADLARSLQIGIIRIICD